MNLEDLGYNDKIEQYRIANGFGSLGVGRVTAEHKERYVVKTAQMEYDAEILGNLRYAAQSRSDFPAVGDWVVMAEYESDKAFIHAVLPRKSVLARQAAGNKAGKQIIATNIDKGIIVQSVDRDFSINRIERYLTICNASNVEPIVVFSKIDLVDETALLHMLESVHKRIKNIPVFAISNESKQGIDQLKSLIKKGVTYCLLGSSGVGKSTLLNTIQGAEVMKTGATSVFSNRGRHVTTHRELMVLENGGIMIDNPGMREVGIADSGDGIDTTFDKIAELSEACRFNDCKHLEEAGCAVLEALNSGVIEQAAYDNYLRIRREKEHFEATVAERRKKEKNFAKMVKDISKKHHKRF